MKMTSIMKTCFVICPIGKKGSPANIHSNHVFDTIIKPALPEPVWLVERSDKLPFSNKQITEEIHTKLRTADFCLIDITALNPNVMFEMGVRFELGLEFMVMAKNGTEIPFDIKDIRVLYYDLDDPKSAGIAVGSIAARASAIQSQEGALLPKLRPEPATTVVSQKELEIVDNLSQRLNAILDSDAAWERNGEGRWNSVEFRYAFGMHWREWIEPAKKHSEDAKDEDKRNWPGHKRAQLSRSEIQEYGMNWPGVVYKVTPNLCVASRLVQEYSLLVFHIARCLHCGVISESSARFFWRAIDLAFPDQLIQEPSDTHEYPFGQFWRWVEFMIFGNTADVRLAGKSLEKKLPWITLYEAIKRGPNLKHHQ